MGDSAVTAILYALYYGEISAAVKPVKRAIAEQTVKILFLHVFVAGEELTFLVAEIFVMLRNITSTSSVLYILP